IETARKAQEETGVPFVTASFEELVEHKDVDVIVVAVPNALHCRVVEKAASCGKAVYCDIPLAANLDEASSMWRAVKESGIPFGMAFQNRFTPAILKAKFLLEEGFLGRIFRIRALYLHSGYIDLNRPISWRMQKELAGGGALAYLGSHLIDLVHFLVGDFQLLSAWGETFIKERPHSCKTSEKERVTVDDWALIDFRLSDGGWGSIECSRFATGSCDELRIEIEGSKGALRYNSMQPNFLEFYNVQDSGGVLGGQRGFKALEVVQQYPPPNALPGKFAVGWVRSHIACVHDFILRLSGKNSFGATIDDGLKVQEVLHSAYALMGL
ncbi:MAG: Gfo/Idh/MocA family oxidoreductase, partial [Candidatus Atribacteria bacterium]|nr:Gfo/Idh/MocA family oxidoreductase [Candidatus Atribacteria bacterium]MCD6350196.1 Gfo/Idh/MocA family oxidoreductase [Candidatus Atribacteria bacterium]